MIGGPRVSDLKSLIRTIPNYPKPGVMFRDVTTLLGNPKGFKAAIEQMAAPFGDAGVEGVAGIEARGFILGGAIADRLGCGFVPIRKRASCPGRPSVRNIRLSMASTSSKCTRMPSIRASASLSWMI